MVSEVRLLWVDGELLPKGEAAVDPRDSGFTLGDELFETRRVREGAIVWM
jgi:branched-chain amino acid aminotransferase